MTASTAMTIVSVNAISTMTVVVPVNDRVQVRDAKTGAEIIERIRDASASVHDIGVFLRRLGPKLDKSDLRVVEYALARARFREGYALTVRQLQILCETDLKSVTHYLRKLFPNFSFASMVSQEQACAVMTNIVEL